MSIELNFLGNILEVPEDLLEYLKMVKVAEQVGQHLYDTCLDNSKKSENGIVEQKDIIAAMEQGAEHFISNLCAHGIYDKTVHEYVYETVSFKEYQKLDLDARKQILSISMDEFQKMTNKMQESEQRAASSIYGSGVTMYSNSVLQLAAHAALESSLLIKQAKAADKQYREEFKELHSTYMDNSKVQHAEYCYEVYLPAMYKVFMLFAFELLERYIQDLTENDKFDSKTLNYTDIQKSTEILRNLQLSEDKKAVLMQAFLKCPYNIQIYDKTIDYGLLDSKTVDTIKLLNIFDDLLVNTLKKIHEYPHKKLLDEDISDSVGLRKMYAMLSDKSDEQVLKDFAEPVYHKVIKYYDDIKKMIDSPTICNDYLKSSFPDSAQDLKPEELELCASRLVSNDTIDSNFKSLIIQCGYANNFKKELFTDIDHKDPFECKKKMDITYTRRLFNSLRDASDLIRAELEAEEIRQEELRLEKIKQDERKLVLKQQIQKWTPRVILVLVILPIIFIIINSFVLKKNITKIVEEDFQNNLNKITSSEKFEFNYLDILEDSRIVDFDFYSQGSEGSKELIVSPHIQIRINSNRINKAQENSIKDTFESGIYRYKYKKLEDLDDYDGYILILPQITIEDIEGTVISSISSDRLKYLDHEIIGLNLQKVVAVVFEWMFLFVLWDIIMEKYYIRKTFKGFYEYMKENC